MLTKGAYSRDLRSAQKNVIAVTNFNLGYVNCTEIYEPHSCTWRADNKYLTSGQVAFQVYFLQAQPGSSKALYQWCTGLLECCKI